MVVSGSKGELRGLKGSYFRHSGYDIIGRLPTKEGSDLLMTSQGGRPG